MSGYIFDGDGELTVFIRITGNKIIIITAGFITINTSTGNIQSFLLRIFIRQKVLLDFNMIGPLCCFYLSCLQGFFNKETEYARYQSTEKECQK